MKDKSRKMMKDKSQEYLMMRQEILQYLEEYQTVRNMMYFVTATSLGFGIKEGMQMPAYLFLLPLVVIVPSYMIAIDYWKCVVRAATYLMVFHEKKIDSSFRWETRHYMLGDPKKVQIINVQLFPYYTCGLACFGLYFVNVDWSNCREIIIGVITFFVCICCSIFFRRVSTDKFIEDWERVKQKESKQKKQ